MWKKKKKKGKKCPSYAKCLTNKNVLEQLDHEYGVQRGRKTGMISSQVGSEYEVE